MKRQINLYNAKEATFSYSGKRRLFSLAQ
ncbi:hypothetical protein EXIGUO8H_40324 [Exiguobacterium sp. 8H]|nr:hypothetical protein EXIGUO8H_40324 [Exiguobacterium sp. 8H]